GAQRWRAMVIPSEPNLLPLSDPVAAGIVSEVVAGARNLLAMRTPVGVLFTGPRRGVLDRRVRPARTRRRCGRAVEPGTHRYSQALPDRTNRFGAEAVGTDACDSPVLFLETEDDLQGLAPP